MSRFSFVLAVLALCGCDKLFPELTGSPPQDLTSNSDGGGDFGSDTLTGSVCLLADPRSPATCTVAALGRRVTVEENRASADVGPDGHFSISLTGVGDRATLAVVDGQNTAGQSTPTISSLGGAVLAAARQNGVVLPCVRRDMMSSLELQAGVSDDLTRGAVLAWVLGPDGKAVAGATAAPLTGATAPLYDGADGLEQGTATGGYGTVAYFDLPIGSINLTLTTGPSAPVAGDTFSLPIRGGAITTAALALPTR